MTISIYIHIFLSYSVTYFCIQSYLFLHDYIFYFCTYFSSTYLSMQLHVPYLHSYKPRHITAILQFFHITLSLSLSLANTYFYIIHSFFISLFSIIPSLPLLSCFSSSSSLTCISHIAAFSQQHHSCSIASAFSQPNSEQLSYLFIAKPILKTQDWSYSFSQDRNVTLTHVHSSFPLRKMTWDIKT